MKIYQVYINEISFNPIWKKEEPWYIDLYAHKTIIGKFLNKKQAEEEAKKFHDWEKNTQKQWLHNVVSKPNIKIFKLCEIMDNLLEFYGP